VRPSLDNTSGNPLHANGVAHVTTPQPSCSRSHVFLQQHALPPPSPPVSPVSPVSPISPISYDLDIYNLQIPCCGDPGQAPSSAACPFLFSLPFFPSHLEEFAQGAPRIERPDTSLRGLDFPLEDCQTPLLEEPPLDIHPRPWMGDGPKLDGACPTVFPPTPISPPFLSVAKTSRKRSSNRTLEDRRKDPHRPPRRSKTGNPVPTHLYPCTFCGRIFYNEARWGRHEEEIHLVKNRWVCALHGVKNVDGSCVYHPNGGDKCGEHCRTECGDKDLSVRSYARKEHLQQHMKRSHGHETKEWNPVYASWKQPSQLPQEFRCGFCAAIFTDLKSRRRHLLAEFRQGKTMDQWRGGWGFPANLVQKATLPLLYNATD
jgi:hypothetical protein